MSPLLKRSICSLYAFPTTILSCPVPSRKCTHSSCPYVLFFNILIYKYIHLHMSFLILASAQTSKLVEAQKRQKKPWVGYKARSNPVDQITNERTHVKSNPWWKPKNWVKCPWQHLILTASILCFNKLHNRVQFSCWFTKKWCQHWADIISLWTFLSYFIISFIHDDTGWLTFLFNSRAKRIQIMYQGKNNYWRIKQISNADYINTIIKNSIPFWVSFSQKLHTEKLLWPVLNHWEVAQDIVGPRKGQVHHYHYAAQLKGTTLLFVHALKGTAHSYCFII